MHFGSTRQSHPRAIADGFHLGRRCFFGTPQDSRARCVRRRCKGAAATHFTHPPHEGRRLLDRTPCTSIRRQPARPTGRRGAAWRPSRRAHVPAQPGPTCTALPCCTHTRTQRPQQPGEARPGRPQPGEQAGARRCKGAAATHFTREDRRLLDCTPCTSTRRQPAWPTDRRGAALRPSRRAHVPAQPGPTCTALPS